MGYLVVCCLVGREWYFGSVVCRAIFETYHPHLWAATPLLTRQSALVKNIEFPQCVCARTSLQLKPIRPNRRGRANNNNYTVNADQLIIAGDYNASECAHSSDGRPQCEVECLQIVCCVRGFISH